MPPKHEYEAALQSIWDTGWVTNRGPLVEELEAKLKTHLDISHMTLMANGTIPLQIAIKALAKGKKIITTPFSYVATTASIVWEGLIPVFADIEPDYLTIDPKSIKSLIDEDTGAILATHVFGNPCNTEALDEISRFYDIPVIYDGAHAFGVTYKGRSLLSYGSASTCSFHATKIFHTGEGGALITADADLHEASFHAHNFGHNGPYEYHGLGINGKMSEMAAALGLCNLGYLDYVIKSRKTVVEAYQTQLDYEKLPTFKLREDTHWNYSYFPVFFKSIDQLERVEKALHAGGIFPRRYFKPSLTQLPYITDCQATPIADHIADIVMCLPLYVGLQSADVDRISNIIMHHLD